MKKPFFCPSIIVLFLFFNSQIFAQGFLKVEGRKIVNSTTGNEVHLKGMGLGGWLLEEGYMLETSSFANSPREIRAKIEDLIGKDNTDEFYRLYHENFVTEKDIIQLKEWGFNSIRLPMHYKYLTPYDQPGVYLEEGFKTIDSLLQWCKNSEMYLILDMHAAPGAQSEDNISDSDGEARLWTEPENQTRLVDLWKKLAERYKDEQWIGGYDLINETAYNLGPNNQPLRDLFVRITEAIRQVDTNHIVYIEGNWYATDFNGLTPAWDENMVYSFHKYWNSTDAGSISYLVSLSKNTNRPLWLGETGENSNQWFAETVALMDQSNIGWAWWTLKKVSSISSPLNIPKSFEYQKLLDYWNGKGQKPTLEFAKAALYNFAKSTNINNCLVNEDVIDALFRQPYTNETVPYTENQIPGTIFGVNYDLGKNNYAYKDSDPKNTGSGSYNNGWAYRNDGVDIELCGDLLSNGFNIGWIETGEWLEYTINVEKTSNYKINVRSSAQNSGGKILLKVDGVQFGDYIDVPVTGGWQSWQTFEAGSGELTAGIHKLKVLFFFGGFNFSHIEFVEDKTVSVEDKSISYTFQLDQNYPNPFNPVTKIKYEIPNNDVVSLKIYNALGKEVVQLINKFQSAGNYEIDFNATELSSGIYFYELTTGSYRELKKMILLK